MSVIVSGMKMPKNCEECPLGEWEDAKYFHCCLMERSYAKTKGEMLDNCPLVEVSDEDSISRKDVIKILEDGWKRGIYPSTGKIMALHSVNPKPRWIPCEERLPEEDYWLGGSGKQFSDSVLVSILNNDDDNEWICISHTIDGEWALNLPKHCKILAWTPLPKPYMEVEG